jgi:hypothetical protein
VVLSGDGCEQTREGGQQYLHVPYRGDVCMSVRENGREISTTVNFVNMALKARARELSRASSIPT